MRLTPNFTHWRAVILHRPDATIDRLTRQLQLFGFLVDTRWEPLAVEATPDFIVVDADQGWTGLLPWSAPDAAPCPVLALLGSEAPSRIAWAYDQGAGAILAKPLNTSAIYPALVMALAVFEERKNVREQIAHLEERARLRPLVLNAVKTLADGRKITEVEAYALLRTSAMRQRQPVEAVAAAFLAGSDPIPEAG
jgi:AmiR/NasT family two-component response regulator